MANERIPIRKVIEKLDAYLNKEDYVSAERLLNYWVAEARSIGDRHGELGVLNEIMGFSRRINDEEGGLSAIRRGFLLIDELGVDSRTAGTVFLNGATTLKAFGRAEEAVGYYEKSRQHLIGTLEPNDPLLGGLYNNFALALVDLNRFDEAIDLYQDAIEVMSKKEDGALEIAVTLMNIAELWEKIGETDALIDQALEQAKSLLDDDRLKHNGYYAFVCRKCAPSFGHFGWFAYQRELNERADEIYAGN